MNIPEKHTPEITIAKHMEKEDLDIYVIIDIDDCVIISTEDFETTDVILKNDVLSEHFQDKNEVCFYDLSDSAAYYRAYGDTFPDRKEIVTMIDSILKALGIELYDNADDGKIINMPLNFQAVEINTIMDTLYYAIKQTRDSAGDIQAFCLDSKVDFTPDENLAMAGVAEEIADKLATWFENGGFDVTMSEWK